MSVLGISFDERGVRLSCRPDPAKPPQPLDACCALEMPTTVAVDKAVRPDGIISVSELFAQCFPGTQTAPTAWPDWLPEAVTSWFRDLLAVIEHNSDAQVVLLGGVEHLAVVAPPHARPAEMEALRGFAARAGQPVTAVAHHAACLAAQLGRFEAMQPFLVCEWDDDFVCRILLAHDTFCHLSPAGETRRRKEIGPPFLERLLAKAFLTKLDGSPSASSLAEVRTRVALYVHSILGGCEPGDAPASKGRSARSPEDALMAPLLPEKPSAVPEEAPPSSEAVAVNEVGPISLSEDEFRAALAPVLALAGNFATNAARDARRNGVDVAVLTGRMFRLPLLLNAVRGALRSGGITSVAEPGDDPALLGVHYCVRARPLLAYDCGFLLKRPDAPLGIGTLVLVRPSAIGEERQSEALELPLPAAASLEISFYTRRLDEAAQGVIYDVMRKHVFVPSRNASGEARVRVAMRVEQGEEHLATVTVDIHDLNSNEHIRFERLPLIGESELDEPPLRDARQLPAVDWTEKIQQARELSQPPNTVDEWRQALEGRAPRHPRAAYVSHILDSVRMMINALADTYGKRFEDLAAGLRTWLLTDELVASRDPEDFQSEGRRLLFDTMHRAAGLVAENGGRHCRAWLRAHPTTDSAPSEASCAERLVNSISQDRAAATDDSGLILAATQLQSVFHLTCSSPYSLNIAW